MNKSMSPEVFKLDKSRNPGKFALIVGGGGLALSAAGYFVDHAQFFYSYLTAFVFWTTIGLGGLFFTMLHHLTGATWSVVLRRLTESIMSALPFLALFFVPVALGLHELYHWSHADAVAGDTLLQRKAAYLNVPFFLIRAAGYFAIWFVLSRILSRASLQGDENFTPALNEKMRRISAPGMVLFALTLTYASFDWLMSLDAHWYSTIFGVYIFSGSVLGILAFVALFALYLRGRGILRDIISVEHYHDLGKLLFAFTVFWAYIAFSQYFLIWYGNIPEETIWFEHRWVGSWKTVSMVILFGHFAIPFLALITRAAKRNFAVLKVMAVWFLLMHWVDLHWIILPGLHSQGASISWMDLTTMLGVGGVFVWYVWRRYAAHPLIPVRDPKLNASIQFTNV